MAFLLMHKYYNYSSLQKNFKISNAFVYEVSHGSALIGGAEVIIKYRFYVNKKKYYAKEGLSISFSVKDRILNTYFPVAYDSNNPSNNSLLTFEREWRRFHLAMPDSLQWMKKYYNSQ